jgi:hypothetical protein
MHDLISTQNKFEINYLKPKIYGFFLIATGNYKQYLRSIIIGIKEKILTHEQKILLISTDDLEYLKQFDYLTDDKINYVANVIHHLGYPSNTLYRYEYFLMFDKSVLKQCDYLIFLNINMQINKKIDTLSLGECDLFFTSHPENNKNNTMFIRSVENNKKSTAYIKYTNDIANKEIYLCGGFNGGKTSTFLNMCNILKKNIENDDKNNMCAKWHDESHLNWFYYNYNEQLKIKIYDHYYCSTYMTPIKKDHHAVRSHNYEIVGWSGNLFVDVLNAFKILCNNKYVGFQFENIKYNSSRQGILKNFYRVENKIKITKYSINTECENFIAEKISAHIEMFNVVINKKIRKFQKKYNDYYGVILINFNVEKIKNINEKFVGKKLYYKQKKTELNFTKILSLSKFICDDDKIILIISELSKAKFNVVPTFIKL